MERTRECGLIWWREGVHGWGDKDCGETGAGPNGGFGGDIFMTVPLVRIN